MSKPRIAFAGGKRIAADPETRMCSIEGQYHIDRYSFDAAPGRVKLYEALANLRARKRRDGECCGTYAGSLAAAKAALKLVAEVTV